MEAQGTLGMSDNTCGATKHEKSIPDSVIDTLARCLLPKIQAYYDSEQGKNEFEEWKKAQ